MGRGYSGSAFWSLALAGEDRRERRLVRRDVRMIGTQRLCADRDRAARERLAAGEATARMLQAAQIVENARHCGMVPALRALGQPQRLAVVPLRLGNPRKLLAAHAEAKVSYRKALRLTE